MSQVRSIQLSTFSGHIGDVFQMRRGDKDSTDFRLVDAYSAVPISGSDESSSNRFSLVFLDPMGTLECFMPQGTYCLQHGVVGELNLFMVPIGAGADGKGIQYQAIFDVKTT